MFGSKDPGKEKRRPATWTHEKLKGGGMINGWKAGDPVWVYVHFMGRSIPCHHEMTDGKLSCPYCAKRPRVDLIGYFPMYDLSGKPIVVVIQDYTSEVMKGISLHDPVKVWRGKEKGDPVGVALDKGRAKYSASSPARRDAADIRCWLLRFWKDQALIDYFAVSSPDDKPTELDELKAAMNREAEAHKEVVNRIRDKIKVRDSETSSPDDIPTVGDILPAFGHPPGRNGTPPKG